MEEIGHIAELLGVPSYLQLVSQSRGDLKNFFRSLMSCPEPAMLIAQICSAAAEKEGKEFRWISRLEESYPGDIGVAAPLYMNIMELKEGEAIYLDAGKIHAYLGGLGIELMANSDNVLRGGLTAKHIDLDELCAVLDFSPFNPALFPPAPGPDGGLVFRPPVEEFALTRYDLHGASPVDLKSSGSCEILLCTHGRVLAAGKEKLVPGDSLFITADQEGFVMEGEGTIFRAAVPQHDHLA